MSVIPPLNFGLVDDDLYRSAHPNELNFPFLESLRLRKIIDLANQDPGPDFRNWLRDQKIEVIHLGQIAGMRSTLKTLSEEEVVEGLRLLLDRQNYPVPRPSCGLLSRSARV
jgi:tyrosine-protein phosphatase OCA1